jgi:transcriptional regulator with XRE-family HTH domain
MNWSKLLRELNDGLKQVDIAFKYGITQSMVSDILNTDREPLISTLRKIAFSEGMAIWQLVQMAEVGDDDRTAA